MLRPLVGLGDTSVAQLLVIGLRAHRARNDEGQRVDVEDLEQEADQEAVVALVVHNGFAGRDEEAAGNVGRADSRFLCATYGMGQLLVRQREKSLRRQKASSS